MLCGYHGGRISSGNRQREGHPHPTPKGTSAAFFCLSLRRDAPEPFAASEVTVDAPGVAARSTASLASASVNVRLALRKQRASPR